MHGGVRQAPQKIKLTYDKNNSRGQKLHTTHGQITNLIAVYITSTKYMSPRNAFKFEV